MFSSAILVLCHRTAPPGFLPRNVGTQLQGTGALGSENLSIFLFWAYTLAKSRFQPISLQMTQVPLAGTTIKATAQCHYRGGNRTLVTRLGAERDPKILRLF